MTFSPTPYINFIFILLFKSFFVLKYFSSPHPLRIVQNKTKLQPEALHSPCTPTPHVRGQYRAWGFHGEAQGEPLFWPEESDIQHTGRGLRSHPAFLGFKVWAGRRSSELPFCHLNSSTCFESLGLFFVCFLVFFVVVVVSCVGLSRNILFEEMFC